MPRRPLSSAAIAISLLMTECYTDPGSLEARERWQAAWRETVAGERLGAVDIEATWSLLWGGWHLKRHDGNFRAAADLLLPYFEHPEIEQAVKDSVFTFRWLIAYSLLKAGDEEEAIAHLRLLIDHPTHKRSALRRAEIALVCFLGEQDRSAMAFEALTDIVQEVVHRVKRRKVRRWIPESKSYAELIQFLDSMVPAKERERAIVEARSRQQREHA